MQFVVNECRQRYVPPPGFRISNIVRVLKWTTILLFIGCLHVSASTYSQQVTLHYKNAPLTDVLKAIQKQTGYSYIIKADDVKKARPVTVHVINSPLKASLDKCFEGQVLSYSIIDKTIIIKPKGPDSKPLPSHSVSTALSPIRGRIVDSTGSPIANANVIVKGSSIGTTTKADGSFSLNIDSDASLLAISCIGYVTQEVYARSGEELRIILRPSDNILDDMQIIAYGTTTRRLSTGNVSKVSNDVISRQPVTNVLQALHGQVAGLQIIQSNGLPGSPITVQIRGRNSINASNNPLYIVDGVPFPSVPIEYTGLTNSEGGVFGSPLNMISPDNIQSIEVLKDADATALYGSRAANGVIMITTKKSAAGKLKTTLNFSSGIGEAARMPRLLNTQQYLQLRRDAFANSGIQPTTANAPDLLSWKEGESFDYFDWYFGNSTRQSDAAITLNGGKGGLSFLLSGNYHYETSVLPSETKFERGSSHIGLNYLSDNGKAEVRLNGYYSKSYNRQGEAGATLLLLSFVPPNYPIYNEQGEYNFEAGVTNYLATNNAYSKSSTDNLNVNLTLLYRILPRLVFRTNLGLSSMENDIFLGNPSITRNPATNPQGISNFSNQSNNTTLLEPQLTYSFSNEDSKLDALIGGTLQKNNVKGERIAILNYPSDLLLESRNYGIVGNTSSTTSEYKYLSGFARITYSNSDKYLLNINLRRDGSSRFGPGKKYGNFYSLGAAWIFSKEKFVQRMQFLSFGKLRGSYGTTGNDGIGDYRYLSLYGSTTNYGEENAIIPKQIANTDYRWEVNKKLEVALDVGLAKDKVLFSLVWYRNRSGNQLVTYALPGTTGFTGYTANLPAIVQNNGWEMELNTENLKRKQFRWTTALNMSFPKNSLVEFPQLEMSSYANSLIIGQSLNVVQQLKFLGIDPATGLTQIQDVNGDGIYTRRSSYNEQGGDYVVSGTTDPHFFGGLNNSISFRNFKLDLFIQYVKQDGYNFRRAIASFGRANNTYVDNLSYWKQPGDQVDLPKPFANSNASLSNYAASTVTFSDASFIRFKTISLSYNFREVLLSRLKIGSARVYLTGQNLWTITKYLGVDPENPSGSANLSIPPLRTFVAGIQISI